MRELKTMSQFLSIPSFRARFLRRSSRSPTSWLSARAEIASFGPFQLQTLLPRAILGGQGFLGACPTHGARRATVCSPPPGRSSAQCLWRRPLGLGRMDPAWLKPPECLGPRGKARGPALHVFGTQVVGEWVEPWFTASEENGWLFIGYSSDCGDYPWCGFCGILLLC